MSRRFLLPVAALIMLAIGAWLRLEGIENWSLNNDEIAEVRWASQPFGDMMRDVRNDLVHPPLDYMLQHLLWRAGANETARRIPSVIFGTGSLALLVILGRSWFSAGAGLAAAFLLAVAPMHIRYSQEVRPYASGVFLMLMSLVLLEVYARNRKRYAAVLWFLAVLLAGGTLYFAGMVAGGVSVVRVFIGRREELQALWRRLPLIVAGWVVLYSPWLPIVARAARRQPIVAAERLGADWWLFRLHAFAAGDQNWERITIGSWFFWAAAAIGLVVALRHRLLRTAAVWFVGLTALSILVLQLRPHYPSPRYLMPAAIGAFLLAGAGVSWMWNVRVLRGAAAMVLIVFTAYSWLTLSRYFSGQRSDWRGVTEFVYERVRPGESVILSNTWVARNLGFYWKTMPPPTDVSVERFVTSPHDFTGPAWIVSAQCHERAPLLSVGLMGEWPYTDYVVVRYLRSGQRMPMTDEICPE